VKKYVGSILPPVKAPLALKLPDLKNLINISSEISEPGPINFSYLELITRPMLAGVKSAAVKAPVNLSSLLVTASF
jgi:hypothetical protein